MARAIWSGAVSFGLVNIPVKAYSATRDHTVHFHQLEKGSGARIRYQKVSEKTGDEVDAKDIELGYEFGRGRYVTASPTEIDQLRPETTRTIDITEFVDLAEIDPAYYANTYWLAPAGKTAEQAYRLLVAAAEEANRAGIGHVVMRNKQYLAAVRARDGALALSTLHFADEVSARSEIDGIPAKGRVDPDQRKLAVQIVESLAAPWDPERYHDTYADELRRLLKRKADGKEIVTDQARPPESEKVVDLMAALQASLDAGAKKKKTSRPKKAAGTPAKSRGKAPAKRSA